MKERFVNFRPLVMILLAFICGILSAFAYLKGFLWIFWTIVGLIIAACIFAILFKRKIMILITIMVLIVMFAGFFDFNVFFKKYTQTEYVDTECSIYGKLTDYCALYTDSAFVVVKNVTVKAGKNVDVFDNKNIGVWLYFDEEFTENTIKNNVGNFIVFDCTLNNAPLFADGINTFYAKNNIYFVATAINYLEFTEGRPSFDEVARQYIRSCLSDNMSKETAPVAIALLLGDKSAFVQELQNGYRTMGISHVFAVSGLHVGFIYTLVGFFVFKLRISKWKALPMTFLPMLFYAWLCGFSASVVRALVMCTCSLLFSAMGVKNDGLNSISIAAIIILIISPFYLFDAGFLMSFAAVIGINCISRRIIGLFFTEVNAIQFVIDTFAISIGASIGVMGVAAYFYGEITLWGFLFNLIITPLISIIFVFLLVGLIPFLSFVLKIPDYFFGLTNGLAKKFASIELGTFDVKIFILVLLIVILVIFVIGGYFNLSKKLKLTTVVVLVLVAIIVGVVAPKNIKTTFAVECFDTNTDCCYVITDDDNNAYIISDFAKEYEVNQILDFCLEKNIKNLYLFVMDYSQLSLDNLSLFSDYQLSINSVYMPLNSDYYYKDLFLESNNIKKFVLDNNVKVFFDDFEFVCLNNGGNYAWYLISDRINLLFCSSMSQSAFEGLCRYYAVNADIIFSSCNEEYIIDNTHVMALVTTNYIEKEKVLTLKTLGRLTIEIGCDNIKIIP